MTLTSDTRIEIEQAVDPDQIREVADLAREIWNEHYTPIIGAGQVAYMLDRFQSEEAIAADIGARGYQYDLLRVGARPVGYAAYRADPTKGEVFLSKIYLLGPFRGKGLSRRLLARVVEAAHLTGCYRIRLTVNKYNASSIKAYQALGFSVIDAVVTDIGGGYSMDDYVMGKTVSQTVATADINFRDPFLLTHEGRYYLFGTEGATCWQGNPGRLLVYTGTDLEQWEGPRVCFTPPPGFWADRNFWAPECHAFNGAFYLFVSFKSPNRKRGTQILRAERPDGPYAPISAGPFTPPEWECLDGTLHVDSEGRPWGVFCHEWVQVGNGTICAVRLLPDLSGPADPSVKPVTLFAANEAAWVNGIDKGARAPEWPGPLGYVTDGPFVRTLPDGRLLMGWSSFSGNRSYTIGQAVSDHGILGPWRQLPQPIYDQDGGHGMFFDTLDGRLMLAIHKPNIHLEERPIFLELEETGEGYRVR